MQLNKFETNSIFFSLLCSIIKALAACFRSRGEFRMEQLPPFHPAGWIHLRFSGIHAILSRDRESLIALRACVARILNGGRSGEGKRGREKYVQSVCQGVGYTGVQVSPMEKLKVEGKEDAWMDFFFFFFAPISLYDPLLLFLFLFHSM